MPAASPWSGWIAGQVLDYAGMFLLIGWALARGLIRADLLSEKGALRFWGGLFAASLAALFAFRAAGWRFHEGSGASGSRPQFQEEIPVKIIGKPCAGNLQARFERRTQETGGFRPTGS